MDGKAFRPDEKSGAVLIPPAFGLAGVNLGTWTGFSSTTYWNAFVNLEIHGKGTFYDPRLNDPTQFPVAGKAGSPNVRNDSDLITAKLAALHFYQLAIPDPHRLRALKDSISRPRGEGPFSMSRLNAPAATFRRSLRSPGSTCIRRRRWASTSFRLTGRPRRCIEQPL